jgi:glycosyltransferase involved in cell wall biosynthesis
MIKKIVQFQYNPLYAGKQILRLHHAFLGAGIDSHIISLYSGGENIDRSFVLGNSYKMIAAIDRKIQKRLTKKGDRNYGKFSYPVFGSDVSKLTQVREADIIYVHWVLDGFLSIKSFKQLARLNKPLVFILHDMWPITGGCHYSFDCVNYETGCKNCPIFISDKKKQIAEKGYQKKLKFYLKYDNIYFVSPSKWLYDCARQSMLTKDKPIFHIPNIIDRTIYKSFDKAIARKILNIDGNRIVIGFGAISINSPYKGWSYLKNAFKVLAEKYEEHQISVLIFGGGYNEEIVKGIPFKTQFLGYLHDDYSLALAYNAIDVFVVPSLADNFPTTIFESMSSGTPVVAFDTGGIPEFIQHKVNGYLSRYKDADDIANGIIFCIENSLEGQILPVLDTDRSINKHFELFKYIDSIKK